MNTQKVKARAYWRWLDDVFSKLSCDEAAFEFTGVVELTSHFLCHSGRNVESRSTLIALLEGLHPLEAAEGRPCSNADAFFASFEPKTYGLDLSDAAGLSISLGLLHQWRLARSSNETASSGRKKLGAYYTPNHIVRTLIDEARAVIVGEESSTRLATLSVCDPACGAGQFLVTWFEELLSAEVGVAKELANNVYGVDLDPIGVWLCRVSFWAALFTRGCELETEFFQRHFRVGNSLIGAEWEPKRGMLSPRLIKDLRCSIPKATRLGLGSNADEISEAVDAKTLSDAWYATCFGLASPECEPHLLTLERLNTWSDTGVPNDTVAFWEETVKANQVFHWFDAFPEIAKGGGFDLILGNPPYVNSIELEFKDERFDAILSDEDRSLRGSADLAYRFLKKGLSLINESGWVYFLLPRAVYSAPSLKKFWQSSNSDVWLRMALLFDDHRLFEGASVFVSGALWQKSTNLEKHALTVSQVDASHTKKISKTIENQFRHWWFAISAVLEGGYFDFDLSAPLVKDEFEVSASMTTSEYYRCTEFLHDEIAQEFGIPMLTSGTIDPATSKWGNTKSRILGEDYLTPRLEHTVFEEAGPLMRRRERAFRPKVLVAGLAARVEAVLVEEPAQGAVSTLTITHHADDAKALKRLEDILNDVWVSKHLRHLLGANALGGGNITISKDFVMNLPLFEPTWRRV